MFIRANCQSKKEMIQLTIMLRSAVLSNTRLSKTIRSLCQTANVEMTKSEKTLSQPLQDAQQLSLAENLQKYGLTVKEVLQLDPKLERRVAITGQVLFFKRSKEMTTVCVQDGRSAHRLFVQFSNKTIKNLEDHLAIGKSIVVSGLIYRNPKFHANTLFGDLVLYLGPFDQTMFRKPTKTVLDWPTSREHLFLRPQDPKSAAVMRVRSVLIQKIHQLMANEDFIHIQTPCMTSTELSEESFQVEPAQKEKYFEKPVYLNESASLHLESVVSGLSRVYTINQGFQASRQLSKLNVAENLHFEVAQIGDSLDEMMNSVEALCRRMAQNVLDEFEHTDLKLITNEIQNPFFTKICNQTQSYYRFTYEEAVEVLNQKQTLVGRDEPLTDYHCKLLSEYFEHYPIFVTHYPNKLKEFNVKLDQTNEKKLAFDLIFPTGVRIASGSVKETNVEQLKVNLQQLNLSVPEPNLDWYFESKASGHCRNYGFKLNLDKFLMTICWLPSARDAISFPRLRKYCPM